MVEFLWTIRSFEGVGPLNFSHTRSDVQAILGVQPRQFRKVSSATSLTDSYDVQGLHAYFDEEDRLSFVEFFTPAQVSFRGQRFLGRSFAEVKGIFQNWDPAAYVDEFSLVSCAHGITIYVENVVEAVGVFRADQVEAYRASYADSVIR